MVRYFYEHDFLGHGLQLVLLKTSSHTFIYGCGSKLPEDSCLFLEAHAHTLAYSIGYF